MDYNCFIRDGPREGSADIRRYDKGTLSHLIRNSENQYFPYTCHDIGVDIHGPVTVSQKKGRMLKSPETGGI